MEIEKNSIYSKMLQTIQADDLKYFHQRHSTGYDIGFIGIQPNAFEYNNETTWKTKKTKKHFSYIDTTNNNKKKTNFQTE